MNPLKLGVFLGPAIVCLALDLLTKALAFEYFDKVQNSFELLEDFLYFSRAINTGIAFGMLQGYNFGMGIAVGIMAIGIPIYAYIQRREGNLFTFAIGMVYGGALGNLYDRWTISHVRDFIDVRFGEMQFPVFNGADAFICIGVALLLIQSWPSTTQKLQP